MHRRPRAPDVSGDLFVQWHQAHAPAFITLSVGRREAPGNRVHFCLGTGQAYAGLDTGDHAQEVNVPVHETAYLPPLLRPCR